MMIQNIIQSQLSDNANEILRLENELEAAKRERDRIVEWKRAFDRGGPYQYVVGVRKDGRQWTVLVPFGKPVPNIGDIVHYRSFDGYGKMRVVGRYVTESLGLYDVLVRSEKVDCWPSVKESA